MTASRSLVIGLNAVIVAVTRDSPRILTVQGETESGPIDMLPHGPLDPGADRTLELSLRRWVRERTGIELGYVEQLYTFGDRDRERPGDTGPRVISVAYFALVREGRLSGPHPARWRDWYSFFPWEDRRAGEPGTMREIVVPALDAWVDAAPEDGTRRDRLERASIAFGLRGSVWDNDRVLERYELLYEVGLVSESQRDGGVTPSSVGESRDLGRPMAIDHRRILATGMGRIRGKLRYRPVVFELLPDAFTLTRLQGVVEALAGVRLHKQNFRRLLERGGLVEGTGRVDTRTGGRPAELFRFRREVLRERRAPGIGIPSRR